MLVELSDTNQVFISLLSNSFAVVSERTFFFQLHITVNSPDARVAGLIPIISLSAAHLFSTLFYFHLVTNFALFTHLLQHKFN